MSVMCLRPNGVAILMNIWTLYHKNCLKIHFYAHTCKILVDGVHFLYLTKLFPAVVTDLEGRVYFCTKSAIEQQKLCLKNFSVYKTM